MNHRLVAAFGFTLCLLVLGAGPATYAADEVAYGPVPTGIEGVIPSERDWMLAAMALAGIEQSRTGWQESEGPDLARASLLLLDETGLKAVAQRLAQGSLPPHVMPHLLLVVAASDHPEADVLLGRALAEKQPLLRMIAADGLGRGRSAQAVPLLRQLASDAVPGVRIAALRSLFALETEQAAAARIEAAEDPEPDLHAARLRWHRRCEDTSPRLLALATSTFRSGRTAEVRTAAAHYLAAPTARAPVAVLEEILAEAGANPFVARLLRWTRGQPREGYDDVLLRRITVEAGLNLLARDDLAATQRTQWLDRAVGWVADPVSMDPYNRDPIPEYRLRERLPDFGAELLEPVVRRLQRGAFQDPREGVVLVRELGQEHALPVLHALLAEVGPPDPWETGAEQAARRFVRSAAAGALRDLGRVGDEALARRLLAGEESSSLKLDILLALKTDPGTWAIQLLGEVAAGPDDTLRSHALNVLEARKEPAARDLLVADLFERMDRPHDRLRPLVQRGDENALAILKRALTDERSFMRKAALDQYQYLRSLRSKPARELLRPFEERTLSPQETQQLIYALRRLAPEEAVVYVRTRWNDFATDAVRANALKLMRRDSTERAWSETAVHGAIDLVFEVIQENSPSNLLYAAAAVLQARWGYRDEDVEAFWRRLLTAKRRGLRETAVLSLAHAGCADLTDLLLPMLSLAVQRKAFEGTDDFEEITFAQHLLSALAHQEWSLVEPAYLDLIEDVHQPLPLREDAAHHLEQRLTDEGRARLMRWLEMTAPPAPDGAGDPGAEKAQPTRGAAADLQYRVTRAIGVGGDESVATTMLATLKRELLGFYDLTCLQRLMNTDPRSIMDPKLVARIQALAAGIALTKHAPTITAMLDLVFDLRFSIYARTGMRRQANLLRSAGVATAARKPAEIRLTSHRTGRSYLILPPEVAEIFISVRVLDDDVLAKGLERVFLTARTEGRLAHFPDLYLDRIIATLRYKNHGAKPKSAEVVERHVRRLAPVGGPIDYLVQQARAVELPLEGRYAEAVAAQEEAVRIVARRNLDAESPEVWMHARSVLDALRGADFAVRKEDEQARNAFRQAVLRAPNNPAVLNTVAWYRALVGFDLHLAEADARRAVVVERRTGDRATLNTLDTLAYVLLRCGKPKEALAALEPRLVHRRRPLDNGLYHLHLAQAYAQLGYFDDASWAVITALRYEPALAPWLPGDALLAPLEAEGVLEGLIKKAQKQHRNDLPIDTVPPSMKAG